MNELIERYIYDVTRRLPEKDRGEVKRELEASILDMLPDSPGEHDIADALSKLGAPARLAEQYRQKPRYLISPAMYELYISVMKTVMPIVAAAFALLSLLTYLTAGFESVSKVIETTVGAVVEGALQTAFWITLGFAIADRRGVSPKPWTVADLPHMPDRQGAYIKRSSSIVGMCLSVFFIALFIMMIVRDEWVMVLALGAKVIYPFSRAALDRLIPYLLVIGIAALAMNGLKLYRAKWTPTLCGVNIVHNVLWASIVIYVLNWPDLFSDEMAAFSKTIAGGADIFSQGMSPAVIFFSVVFAVCAAVDIGESIWKTYNGMRHPAV
jgi:hypothetical protein